MSVQNVGIAGRWRSTIADWVDANYRDAMIPGGSTAANRITFCVEGNIGAGKSTYLDMVKMTNDVASIHEMIEVVQEPVDMWQDLSGENLLELFYKDPERYAFTFQQYVLITRIKRVRSPRSRPLYTRSSSVACLRWAGW
jgi:hypothetical protein